MIGLLATGEDPSVHIAKLVLAGLVAVGLLVVVIYAFAAPTAGAYRLLLRRRRAARVAETVGPAAGRHAAPDPAEGTSEVGGPTAAR